VFGTAPLAIASWTTAKLPDILHSEELKMLKSGILRLYHKHVTHELRYDLIFIFSQNYFIVFSFEFPRVIFFSSFVCLLKFRFLFDSFLLSLHPSNHLNIFVLCKFISFFVLCSAEDDPDINKEYQRQRQFLEKNIDSLNRKLQKDAAVSKKDNLRIIQVLFL
jgi:hypothetical protein